MTKHLVLLAALVGAASAAEVIAPDRPTTFVANLTGDTFEEFAMSEDYHAFVKFYAPWCGHCKTFAPRWDTISLNLRGSNVKLGKIDAKNNKDLAKKLRVFAYPKLLLFKMDDKEKPVHYKGKKTDVEIMNWLHREVGLERKANMQFTRQAGRVRKLDLLARKFMKEVAKRPTIRDRCKKIEDDIQHKNARYAEIYTEVMDGVIAEGEKYLFLHGAKLAKALEDPLALPAHKWENYAKMLNIIREFVPYVHKKAKRKYKDVHLEVTDQHIEELHNHKIHRHHDEL